MNEKEGVVILLTGILLVGLGLFGARSLGETSPEDLDGIGKVICGFSFLFVLLGTPATRIGYLVLKYHSEQEDDAKETKVRIGAWNPPQKPEEWSDCEDSWQVYAYVCDCGPIISSEISKGLPITAESLIGITDQLLTRGLLNHDGNGYTANPWDTQGAVSLSAFEENKGAIGHAEAGGELTTASQS